MLSKRITIKLTYECSRTKRYPGFRLYIFLIVISKNPLNCSKIIDDIGLLRIIIIVHHYIIIIVQYFVRTRSIRFDRDTWHLYGSTKLFKIHHSSHFLHYTTHSIYTIWSWVCKEFKNFWRLKRRAEPKSSRVLLCEVCQSRLV